MEEIFIHTEWIGLGQFLKLAGVITEGWEAKELLAGGEVQVGGQRETRRGRKLRPGDTVDAGGGHYLVKKKE